jgi:plastocyanin
LKPRTIAICTAWLSLTLAAAGPPGHAEEAAQVVIAQQRFLPAKLSVKAGTTVTWVNAERRSGHAVRSTGRANFASPLLMPGQSWALTFDKPGVYPYACGPHPEMQGTIEVTE